jgi:1,4-alpha-glucan branching enzyme
MGPSLFDGLPLYEAAGARADPQRRAQAPSSAAFDLRRGGVRSLLLSSALFWLLESHVDGLRLPGMAGMLYLDHARAEGEWTPNQYGGNESLEAIAFLRELAQTVRERAPGTLLIAEESSGWPQLTRPPWVGGLGFHLRWNVGWRHDTLEYFAQDPVYRHYHHDLLTLSPLLAARESYLLPLDCPGGSALLQAMPGDDWQRFANLRLLLTYAWSHPGKKLLCAGGEYGLGSGEEGPDWSRAVEPRRAGLAALVRDLNRLYRQSSALHRKDSVSGGFEWIDRHDAPQSILAYLRRDGDELLVVALNFTPVPRHRYRIGLPLAGAYREVLNSDSAYYRGSNLGNGGDLTTEPVPWMGRPYSVEIVLPPLAGVILRPASLEDTGA